MAADPALSPTRIAEAMRAFFTALSQPDTLPEFQSLQVSSMSNTSPCWLQKYCLERSLEYR